MPNGDVDVSLLWRWIDKNRFEPQQLADDLAAAVAAGTGPLGCPDPTGPDPNACVVYRKTAAAAIRWSIARNCSSLIGSAGS